MLTIRDYLAQRGGPSEDARYRQALGTAVVLVAQMQGKSYAKVPDPEFGEVNEYPIDLLDEVVPKLPTVEAAAAVAKALKSPTNPPETAP